MTHCGVGPAACRSESLDSVHPMGSGRTRIDPQEPFDTVIQTVYAGRDSPPVSSRNGLRGLGFPRRDLRRALGALSDCAESPSQLHEGFDDDVHILDLRALLRAAVGKSTVPSADARTHSVDVSIGLAKHDHLHRPSDARVH